MSRGTKVFRSIVCVLLALCILLIALLIHDVYLLDVAMSDQKGYGFSVAGVSVTRENEDDILGDGTVFYDSDNNVLVFADAEIKTDRSIIESDIDLGIYLMGENKFISSGNGTVALICAADNYLDKDLYICGDGSLTIEYLNPCANSSVIQCSNLTVLSDITITTPESENISNGIVCESSFKLLSGATVTVNGSPSKSLVAFRVRGNAILEAGTAINVTVENGSTEAAKAISISGDFIVGNECSVNVSVADDTAKTVEGIHVNGLLEVGEGATVTASTAKSYAIECYGAIKLCDDAVLSATSADSDVDVICYGAVGNYGATVNGEIKALGQLYDKLEK